MLRIAGATGGLCSAFESSYRSLLMEASKLRSSGGKFLAI